MPLAKNHVSDIALAVARLGAARTAELLDVRLVELPRLMEGHGDIPPLNLRRLLDASQAARKPAGG